MDEARSDIREPEDDLLWKQLKTLPAFRALLRSVESHFYQSLALESPLLDVGCGDGHFARQTFAQPLTAGIDPWWGPLRLALDRDTYESVHQALGNELPFASNTFATVISNSVLEHIPDVQPVLDEIARVMVPGGRLVITMPSHYFTEWLGGAQFFEQSGADGLASAYRRFFNRVSRHAHTDSAETWAGRLATAGFSVERWQYYFSRNALHALEWGHIQGLPALVSRALTGHWVIAPWRDNLRRTEQWVRPIYEEGYGASGAYLLMIARKEASGPIEPALPPASPLRSPTPFIENGDVDDSSESDLEADLDRTRSETSGMRSPNTPAETPEMGRRAAQTLGATLTLLALLFAATSKWLFASEQSNAGGVWFLGLSLVSLAALAWFTGGHLGLPVSGKFSLPRIGPVSSRAWYIIPALILSMLATTMPSLFAGGGLFVSMIVWLAAIGLGAYALGIPTPSSLSLPAVSWRSPRMLLVIGIVVVGLFLRVINLGGMPGVLNGSEANIGLDLLRLVNGNIVSPFSTGWLTQPILPYFWMGIPLKVFGSSIVAVRALSPLAGVAGILLLIIIVSRLWNWRVTLVAGILFTGSNAAIHYARLGMTNIYDPLIALAAMGGIAVAARYEKRQLWLLAGAAAGLTPYFFTSAHLFPIMLTALAILVAISPTRIQLRQQGRSIIAGVLMALVVALPQLLHYASFPEVFMERANTLGILQNGWLLREVEATGQSAGVILQSQFRNALLLFNAQGDRSLAYNSGVPMLSFGPALLFLPALSLAIWRWRQFKYQVLLAWILVPVVFGGTLMVEPNSSHRLLIALPAVLILVAELFVWIGERLGELFDLEPRRLLFYMLFAAVLITLPDLLFYFGTYQQEGRFADRNTVIASEIASYLNDLDGEWRAYFHGAPHMYIDFPTIPFLVRTVEPYDTLLNVLEPGVPVVPDGTENATFIFLPERQQELSLVRDAYPGGLSETMVGNSMNPLFTVYEVTFR